MTTPSSPLKSRALLISATTIAIAAATPARACPTAADLPTGIEITYDTGTDDPFILIYQRRPDGVIVEIEDYGDGELGYIAAENTIMESEYYITKAGDPTKRDQSRYSYTFEIPFPLQNWSSVSGTQTETTDTGETTTIPAKINIKGTRAATIGACAYEVTDTDTTLYHAEGFLTVSQAYSEALGFAYLLGYWQQGDGASLYTPTAIRALP